MPAELHVFGIRHHGPGSAWSLERALDELDPEVVLIEGPPEADDLIKHMVHPAMRPPVALLVYVADDPSIASFYPFAEFSPEWRAALWAQTRNRPVRFIDMPAENTLARRMKTPAAAMSEGQPSAEQPTDEPVDEIERDPLTALARAAGRDDGEGWWNDLIEETDSSSSLFAAIENAMATLRQPGGVERPSREHEWNERREAHMRLAIADTMKSATGKVAVVVGAWHAPALTAKKSLSEDRTQLKGLPKVKITATWAPWSEPRLAAASGYGAGVISPRWYRHLWEELNRRRPGERRDGRKLTTRWLTQSAHLMRDAGQLSAPASIIDAVRLAETLAILRDRSLPGLVELKDAFVTALAYGEETQWLIIERRLVIGTDVGELPRDVPQTPLQTDLQREIKRLRVKLEAIEQEASLDLRTDAGQDKSWLFRRLRMINVPWATLLDQGRSRGTFRERWRLLWQPEFSVLLAEALIWGATIEQAASNAAISRAQTAVELPPLADLVRECLFAGLRDAAAKALSSLQQRAATSNDIGQLMAAAAPLAETLRYGEARDIPKEELHHLLLGIGENVCINLMHASRNVDADTASALLKQIKEFDRAVALLEDPALTEDWPQALSQIADDREATPLIAGVSVRILYDRGTYDIAAAERALGRALSPSVAAADAGAWLDGFLSGGGHVLLHDQALRDVVDRWLTQVADAEFMTLLPMLRRAFAGFDSMERRRLLDAVRQPTSVKSEQAQSDDDAPGFAKSLPLLKLILGLP